MMHSLFMLMTGKWKNILMGERRLTARLDDFHQLDLHFLSASHAWRMNKREIFAEAGSSGSFEYDYHCFLFHRIV